MPSVLAKNGTIVRLNAQRANPRILMRHLPKFTKADVLRAAKAVLAAGVGISRVEIEPVSGKITIMTNSSSDSEKKTDLDIWIARDARQT